MNGNDDAKASTSSEFLRDRDADSIATQLADLRARAREVMQEFNIPMMHICEMARLAEERISDTALRAEFLRILIDVHEIGREAKRRGIAVAEKSAVEHPAEPGTTGHETRLFAPTSGASDAVSDSASRDFFDSLGSKVGPGRAGQ